jgi:antitoxin HicB
MLYPILLDKTPEYDGDTRVGIQFVDFPEGISFAENEEEVQVWARDCLETVIEMYLEDKKPLPFPSKNGDAFVTLPILKAAKVKLILTMQKQNIRRVDLCRRLQTHTTQVERILDIKHSSKIEWVEKALNVLGEHLVLEA